MMLERGVTQMCVHLGKTQPRDSVALLGGRCHSDLMVKD